MEGERPTLALEAAESEPIGRGEAMSWCLNGGGWLMVGATALVVLTAVWAVTRLFPPSVVADPAGILDARLARGEVDVDTYRRLRAELAGTASSVEAHR
jgi:putative membrane protein